MKQRALVLTVLLVIAAAKILAVLPADPLRATAFDEMGDVRRAAEWVSEDFGRTAPAAPMVRINRLDIRREPVYRRGHVIAMRYTVDLRARSPEHVCRLVLGCENRRGEFVFVDDASEANGRIRAADRTTTVSGLVPLTARAVVVKRATDREPDDLWTAYEGRPR